MWCFLMNVMLSLIKDLTEVRFMAGSCTQCRNDTVCSDLGLRYWSSSRRGSRYLVKCWNSKRALCCAIKPRPPPLMNIHKVQKKKKGNHFPQRRYFRKTNWCVAETSRHYVEKNNPGGIKPLSAWDDEMLPFRYSDGVFSTEIFIVVSGGEHQCYWSLRGKWTGL